MGRKSKCNAQNKPTGQSHASNPGQDKGSQTSTSLIAQTDSQRECVKLACSLVDLCSEPLPTAPSELRSHAENVFSSLWELRHLQGNGKLLGLLTLDKPQEIIERFLKWGHENEVVFSGVTVSDCGEMGLGLTARQDISRNELILQVPRDVMFTFENSDWHDVLLKDPLVKGMPNVALAMALLCELTKGRRSFWGPYLQVLPNTFTTPIYFTAEHIQQLMGSPAYVESVKMGRNVGRQYSYFYQLIRQRSAAFAKVPLTAESFTLEAYQWAVSTVMTRMNYIPDKDGQLTIPALIPLWDMANHAPGQITTDYDIQRQEGVCYAMDNYKTGDQVFIYYGKRSNTEFLVHNGFVICGNDHMERLSLPLGISSSDPLSEIRTKALRCLGLSPNEQFTIDGIIYPDDVVVFAQVFSASKEELECYIEAARDDDTDEQGATKEVAGDSIDKLRESLTSETISKAWSFLAVRVELLLRRYSKSQKENATVLHDGTESLVANLVTRYLLEEQKRLETLVDVARDNAVSCVNNDSCGP